MTPTRYQACLDSLRLSQRGLARVLGCSDRLTREWATGAATVPREIGVWLESCLALRSRRPNAALPKPMEWRHHPVVPVTYRGEQMSLRAACEAAGIPNSRTAIRYHVMRHGLTWQAAFDRVAKSVRVKEIA